jgi:hypothetical protein
MQEINRAAALLGPKIQECNTRDKQELGAACVLDHTIGLLSSQTLARHRWPSGVARDRAFPVRVIRPRRCAVGKIVVITASR